MTSTVPVTYQGRTIGTAEVTLEHDDTGGVVYLATCTIDEGELSTILGGGSLIVSYGGNVVRHIPEPATTAIRCPECDTGKHGNCDGTALDTNADELVPCPCAEGGHA